MTEPIKPKDFPRPKFRDLTILGLDLEDTCTSHPEQYNVWLGEEQVGHLRLRCRWFRAHVPFVGGDVVYEADDSEGHDMFFDHERMHYLTEAVKAIIQHRDRESEKPGHEDPGIDIGQYFPGGMQ
jgi:hypothetical protein